uniref:Uncharacterized protein n=1 Tax=Setaria digitata TaxID=48799 RepID=A0A915PI19_9BILA
MEAEGPGDGWVGRTYTVHGGQEGILAPQGSMQATLLPVGEPCPTRPVQEGICMWREVYPRAKERCECTHGLPSRVAVGNGGLSGAKLMKLQLIIMDKIEKACGVQL